MLTRPARAADPPRLPEYPARPYGPSHPHRLAAVARLHGLEPAPPSQARILELGCGAAVNLLSIASSLPGARCVGIDADADAVDRGRALADSAGLSHVELICADLRHVGDLPWPADYILVHGVWSWVPDDVRAAIVSLCATKLASGGVALISYNALPGWYAWLPARRLARLALAREPDADPVEVARRAVDLARSLHGPDEGPYGSVLAAALARYEQLEPGLLLRDDLAEGSTPFWLQDVADRFTTAGLNYLGEAVPDHWWHWRAARLTADRVRGAAEASVLARQQFADLAAGVDFKASLFSAGPAPALEPDPLRIADFYAASRGDSPPLPASASPAMRELAEALTAARPQAVAISELARRGGRGEESAARALLRLVAEGRADLYADSPPWSPVVADCPEVPPLARVQARTSAEVTTLRHEQIVLRDPKARALLGLMDGTRNRRALADELARPAGVDRAGSEAAVLDFLGQLADLGLLRDHAPGLDRGL